MVTALPPEVGLELHGAVALILLQDAARHNALSPVLVSGALQALQQSRDMGAKAVVFCTTAANFCAGADIREMLASDWLFAHNGNPDRPSPPVLFEAIESDPRPMVAAVRGMVLGGGVELTLACDLVLAADDAVFSLPEIGLGVVPNTAMARLPAIIGRRAALELILSRRRIPANEALGLGLINRVVTRERLLDEARGLAEGIVAGAPPAAIAAVKNGMGHATAWSQVQASLARMDSAEWGEGLSAFLARRKPDYERFWNAAAHREQER